PSAPHEEREDATRAAGTQAPRRGPATRGPIGSVLEPFAGIIRENGDAAERTRAFPRAPDAAHVRLSVDGPRRQCGGAAADPWPCFDPDDAALRSHQRRAGVARERAVVRKRGSQGGSQQFVTLCGPVAQTDRAAVS